MRLSHRYIPARSCPDKAVSLLDTACARVAISQHATPPEVEDRRGASRRSRPSSRSSSARRRSASTSARRRKSADEKLAREERRAREELEARWKDEQALVDQDPRRCAPSCARGAPVEGTERAEKKAGDQATRRTSGSPTPSRKNRASSRRRAEGAAGAACRDAGRDAADPADRRRAGRRGGGAGLDRHPGRPHGEERDRDGAQARRHAGTSASSGRSTPWR